MKKSIFLTGCAGFIGSHLLDKLLAEKHKVIGVDDFNDYYNPRIKEKNVSKHLTNPDFKLIRQDVGQLTIEQFNNVTIDTIIHLAARAGVRSSIPNPMLYERVNVGGTLKLLELGRSIGSKQFIFGSSSSVYGNSSRLPFSEDDPCDKPVSPYAATKRAAELLCYTYSQLYKIPITVLRFFTVYGPRNRPDMAAFMFMDSIARGKPISVFGEGTSRDYTFISDIVEGISLAVQKPFHNLKIINLGNASPVPLPDFIHSIERIIGKKAKLIPRPLPPGDVSVTYADISLARKLLLWKPRTPLETGLGKLWSWYKQSQG